MRLPLTLSGLLLTLGMLAGQGPTLGVLGAPPPNGTPGSDPFVWSDLRPWPSGVEHTGVFLRAIPARLTGHVMPDVVLLNGEQPLLMSAPAIHTHVGPLPSDNVQMPIETARDFAVLRGRGVDDGSNPALDALALVGDAGLMIWRRNPGSGGVSVTTVAGTGWQTVRRLATHPADPLVIFGIDDNGVIMVAEHTSTGYVTSQVEFPTLLNPLAIACVKWDGDNNTKLAVLTTRGLTIVDRQGNTITEEQKSAESGALTLVRGGTQFDEECVAWLTPASSGGSELRLRSSTNTLDVPLHHTFVDLAACDWNNDGYEEVLLSNALNEEITLMMGVSTSQPAFVYDPATAIRIVVAAQGNRSPNCCAVATADFDADGDGDLIVAIEPDTSTTNSGPELRMVQSRLYDNGAVVTPVFENFYNPSVGQPTVNFSFTPGPGGSHTLIVAWAVGGEVDDLDWDWRDLHPNSAEHRFSLPVDMNHLGLGGNYVIMVQPANVVNGHVVEVAKPSLSTLWIPTNGGPGGTQVGGSTGSPPLPPPPDDDPPDPGG